MQRVAMLAGAAAVRRAAFSRVGRAGGFHASSGVRMYSVRQPVLQKPRAPGAGANAVAWPVEPRLRLVAWSLPRWSSDLVSGPGTRTPVPAQPPSEPPTESTTWEKLYAKVKKIALEMWNGSKLLYQNTKAANAIQKRRKAGESIARREHVFVRNNRMDLLRCIPILLIWKGIPLIHNLILPFYIYYARHMLPSTYHFFEEKSDEFKERKEDKHLHKLLEGDRVQEPWEHQLVKLLPMNEPWARSRVQEVLVRLQEFCRIEMLSRRQLAAICYALALHPTSLMPAPLLRRRLLSHQQFLQTDDEMLRTEGVASLTVDELREACQHRGMSIWGESDTFLRNQLQVWLRLTESNPSAALTLLVYTHGFRVREMVLAEDDEVARVALLRAPEAPVPPGPPGSAPVA